MDGRAYAYSYGVEDATPYHQGTPYAPGAPPADSAPYIGAEWEGEEVERQAFCAAMRPTGDQCGARPAKGTAYCAGHLRSLEKAAQAAGE